MTLCENCNKYQASVRVTEVATSVPTEGSAPYSVQERNLCEICAQAMQLPQTHVAKGQINIFHLLHTARRSRRQGLPACSTCGMDLEEFPAAKPHLARYARGAYEPVRSAFNLSFHSIVHLLEQHDADRIRAIVDKSFLAWHLHDKARRKEERGRPGGHTGRVWDELVQKVTFRERIGYLSRLDEVPPRPSVEFHAGARILRHVQIAEIAGSRVRGGLRVHFDGQNRLDGQFEATVCP